VRKPAAYRKKSVSVFSPAPPKGGAPAVTDEKNENLRLFSISDFYRITKQTESKGANLLLSVCFLFTAGAPDGAGENSPTGLFSPMRRCLLLALYLVGGSFPVYYLITVWEQRRIL